MKLLKYLLCLLLLTTLGSCSKKDEVANPPDNNESSAFILVEAGSFWMGDTSFGPYSETLPVHKVNLSSYHIGKYEVTQAEWNKLMSFNPSIQTGDNLPVSRILWMDAIEYCNKRSQAEELTPCYTVTDITVKFNFKANGYRLPTEAEWEYAARGGKYSHGYKYSGSDNPDEVAWFRDNSGGQIHEVGKKKPNELGIYDMSGNVFEWCWDIFLFYPSVEVTDPANPDGYYLGPESRVARGGKYDYDTLPLSVTWRYSAVPTDYYYQIGLRLVKK